MNEPSLKRLKYILDRNCLWLDLIESPPQDVYFANNASLLFPVKMSFIVLKVKRKRTGYRKNRLIKISERQLDDAIKLMINDSKFKDRYENGSLTVTDVEELIRLATYGTLILDLFEY